MKEANSKKIKIIIPIIIILLIIALVVGVLLFRKSNNTPKKSTGTEWGDWYVRELLLDTKEHKQNYEKRDGSTISVTKDEFANTKNCTIRK